MANYGNPDEGYGIIAQAFHWLVAMPVFAPLSGHIGTALRHAFRPRDGVAHRMLPWKPRRKG